MVEALVGAQLGMLAIERTGKQGLLELHG